MARVVDPFVKVTSPRIFLVRMMVFLALCVALAAVLYRQIWEAFLNNPGLNGVIFGVLAVGIILAIRQVMRLFPEVGWVNAFRLSDPGVGIADQPVLLAPMAALLGDRVGRMAISQTTMRSILDSIGTRLDESRDIGRYLTGLLVFLGLLGTFWGLLETVSAIGGVIGSLQVGPDSGTIFEDLKNGLAAPLGGMGTAFSSSLFGLSGSLVLGFLDLQAGQAQNRFYTDLEDWLSTTVRDLDQPASAPMPQRHVSTIGTEPLLALPAPGSTLDYEPLIAALSRLEQTVDESGSHRVTSSMTHLAESLQGLVTHMRTEQALLKQVLEAQVRQQEDLRFLSQKLDHAARIAGAYGTAPAPGGGSENAPQGPAGR